MVRSQVIIKLVLLYVACLWACTPLRAKVDKLRVMWEGDASSSAIIGWNQVSGEAPTLYFGTSDKGKNAQAYLFSKSVTTSNTTLRMRNHFVRLNGLQADTYYYFVIADSEGISKRYYFKTGPAISAEGVSIISGGDSRNRRDVRQQANMMVSKVKPSCVLFSGDMTESSSSFEWKAWLDDWQLTIGADGRIIPLVVARGNHEPNNQVMTDLFGLQSAAIYYSVKIGGNLLNVITLNSLHPSGPAQTNWLKSELSSTQQFKWHFVQYHHSISPHTSRKKMRLDLLKYWSPLFYQYGVDVAIESDAHVMKTTYPLKPSNAAGAERGFIRDPAGTVYIGEGCWGAPLRNADIKNDWTRYSGKFNQFKLLFVDATGIEIRTIPIAADAAVLPEFDEASRFIVPSGFPVWEADSGGVVSIGQPSFAAPSLADFSYTLMEVERDGQSLVFGVETKDEPNGCVFEVSRSFDGGNTFHPFRDVRVEGGTMKRYVCTDSNLRNGVTVQYKLELLSADRSVLFSEFIEQSFGPAISNSGPVRASDPLKVWRTFPRLDVGNDDLVRYAFTLSEPAEVSLKILSSERALVESQNFSRMSPGRYVKDVDVVSLTTGNYILLVFADKKLIKKYRFVMP